MKPNHEISSKLAGDGKSNWQRRSEAFDDWMDSKPFLFRLLCRPLVLLFNIFNWILEDIEMQHGYTCRWCGREFLSVKKVRECCSERKKMYGPYPRWNGPSGGYGDVSCGFDGSEKYFYDGIDRYTREK